MEEGSLRLGNREAGGVGEVRASAGARLGGELLLPAAPGE